MTDKFGLNCKFAFAVSLCLILGPACLAVTSKVARHAKSSDLLKGKTENVVIGSRGTIQLGRSAEALIREFDEFGDVWSVNCVVVSGGTVYFGTSPNGGIYKYSLNKLTKIYPNGTQSGKADEAKSAGEVVGAPAPASADASRGGGEKHLSNEHIFALATDVSGRLLAGMSGKNCRLCRYEGNKMETIFEPNDAKYIFAIAIDEGGDIYVGTGPEGKVYKLNSLGKKPELVYKSRDKNILSLASGPDGFVYAGSDGRGLVYRINTRTKEATVLYDSEQPEITALLSTESSKFDAPLYAAATSAKIVQTQTQFAAAALAAPPAGRPEAETKENGDEDKSSGQSEGGRKLEVAHTEKPVSAKPPQAPPSARKGAKPGQASYIYKITQDGFVTEAFSEAAVFFCLDQQGEKLLAGTGNNAQLFSVDPASEQHAVIYEDEQASQITAVVAAGDSVYLGTANPAKLIKLGSGFAYSGTYKSDLIDAGQPARWGKLQLEADIPAGCKVQVASRSGNVKDINDPTFSEWSERVEVTEPVQLQCPLGRFCQYKLILQSPDGKESPLIREIVVASTVPNLAPKVEAVTVGRIATAGKKGYFKISYTTKDDNNDKLIHKIDFRKAGRTNWIELKDKLEAKTFEWNGRTVEDGRYEVRVTASDARSNTTLDKLTGSRVSEAVVVDNTGPAFEGVKITSALEDNINYRTCEFKVVDKLSAIGKLEYTIDSNTDWIGTVPDDLVYDTKDEKFTIKIDADKELPKGDHVLTVRVSDSVGNVTYRTFEVNVD
jgi:hypothetical protein